MNTKPVTLIDNELSPAYEMTVFEETNPNIPVPGDTFRVISVKPWTDPVRGKCHMVRLGLPINRKLVSLRVRFILLIILISVWDLWYYFVKAVAR